MNNTGRAVREQRVILIEARGSRERRERGPNLPRGLVIPSGADAPGIDQLAAFANGRDSISRSHARTRTRHARDSTSGRY
jgi:hypothetical protein